MPVYAQRGPSGGIALAEGWQTTLTGLTQPEAQALAAVAAPGALAGHRALGGAGERADRLSAALPAVHRSLAEHARQRLHVDASGWFQGRRWCRTSTSCGRGLQDRKVWLAYRDFDGEASERVVEP